MPVEIGQFLARLHAAGNAQVAAAVRGVDVFGEHVIGDAQQLVPVKTGALQASGTTQPAEIAAGAIEKVIGFNTSYAAAVHERLSAAHKVGQAKFLEAAMQANTAKFAPFIADFHEEGQGTTD